MDGGARRVARAGLGEAKRANCSGTLTSLDGTMEASIGKWESGQGRARKSGTFLVIREKTGGTWRVVQDSQVPAPPAK